MMEKRNRSANFSRDETDKLISLIETRRNIVDNKKSDASTWQEKEKMWREIEVEFNSSVSEVHRSMKHLKLKYESLKRDTRKKVRKIADGETCKLTPAEEKVKEFILLSLCGDDSIYDSDQITNQEAANVESEEDSPALSDDNMKPEDTHFVFCPENGDNTPQEKRPFDRLADSKIDVVKLQKRLIDEELEEKKLKTQMLQEEMEHRRQMHHLEKQEMVLKIEILKSKLENAKKCGTEMNILKIEEDH